MLQKKNEGILFSAEIRVVGSYTDRPLKDKKWKDKVKKMLNFLFVEPVTRASTLVPRQHYFLVSKKEIKLSSNKRLRKKWKNGYLLGPSSTRGSEIHPL